ncbi:MAG: YciI family protein [Pirellula sp.]
MAKFMLIYRDPSEPRTQPSAEEMQAFLALWGEWFQKFGPKILDGGDALLPTGRVVHPDGNIANGPYVEAKEMIGGYSVVEAEHYEAAVAIAKECPIIQVGGAIEVREFAGYA